MMISSVKGHLPYILTVVFLSSTCYGASFYVADTACNDSYVGTEAQPWCSIPKGIAKLVPGDTLYVKNGTYSENIYLTGKSGTPSQPITVRAYPGHKPIIWGGGFDSGRNRFTSCNYFILDGFDITNSNHGVLIEDSNDFVLKNSLIHNIGQEGIHVTKNSHHITIEYNYVHDTGMWIYNGEGIYIGTSSSGPADNTNNVTVKNNVVFNTRDEGVELKPGTSHCVVDNNLFYNTGNFAAIEVDENQIPGVQQYPGNPSHVVSNNTIRDVSASGATAAIRAGTGCTVYNNIIFSMGSTKYGIVSDMVITDSYTRRIYHNTIDVPSARALVINNGAPTDARNNIGPIITGNIATSDAYYANKAAADYHLTKGSAAVDAGDDLTGTVVVDIEGKSRQTGLAPDLGAYEYFSGLNAKMPHPPYNLAIN